ncbi:hypothetical protein [Variovorax sp.]|uniref:alpha-2-macroglobulin family protein n=1 Tax=Variovorax sp. TaxID=1871043 RepID=UPI0025CC518D|nr:hypothetical protein [Variovorax sp.]
MVGGRRLPRAARSRIHGRADLGGGARRRALGRQLGRGLGRESSLAQQGETQGGWTWPSHVERATDSWRAYFRYVPRGHWRVEYTVRLNNAGEFRLPPVRAEAMYAPEVFGEGVPETMTVQP